MRQSRRTDHQAPVAITPQTRVDLKLLDNSCGDIISFVPCYLLGMGIASGYDRQYAIRVASLMSQTDRLKGSRSS